MCAIILEELTEGRSLSKGASVAPAVPLLRAVLTLNVAPIRFAADTLRVGRLPYEDDVKYRALREAHRQTHVFRFDSRTGFIFNTGLAADTAVLGEASDSSVHNHLSLLSKAVQHMLFAWLVRRRTILRPAKPLQCWGHRKAALLSAAIREANLEPMPGLDVLLRHSFDTRVLQPSHDGAQPYLGLLLDISTSNEISIPVAELIKAGLDPRGLYVCQRQGNNEEILPKLDTLGCVAAVIGSKLVLTDTTTDGPVDANEVILEPRLENLETVIRLYYGAAADRVLEGLQHRRQPDVSAEGKLEYIFETLDGIAQVLPLNFSGELTAQIGALLQLGDPAFPGAITVERPGLLFGPQGRETGQRADAGIKSFGPYKYMQHERNEPVIAVICEIRVPGPDRAISGGAAERF